MKTHTLFLVLILCGCAGGPTKTYYNPATAGKGGFKGPITMNRVENVAEERSRLLVQGYSVVGTTIYGGKHPKAAELKAQAKRAGANHVIYSSDFVPAPPGSWSFNMNQFGGWGGSGGGTHNVKIVFMGK